MTSLKVICILSVIGFSFSFFGLAVSQVQNPSIRTFSRANCVNNESITWDWVQVPYLEISAYSYHLLLSSTPTQSHDIFDERYHDNAAKAIHWGEGTSLYWFVAGMHRWKDYNSIQGNAVSTAFDCSFF